MPDWLILTVLILCVLFTLFSVALCLGLACVSWFAFSERRMRARYNADVTHVQAAIRRGSRITEHRMRLK